MNNPKNENKGGRRGKKTTVAVTDATHVLTS